MVKLSLPAIRQVINDLKHFQFNVLQMTCYCSLFIIVRFCSWPGGWQRGRRQRWSRGSRGAPWGLTTAARASSAWGSGSMWSRYRTRWTSAWPRWVSGFKLSLIRDLTVSYKISVNIFQKQKVEKSKSMTSCVFQFWVRRPSKQLTGLSQT